MKNVIMASALIFAGLGMGHAFAADSTMEKTGEAVQEAGQDTAKHVKKTARAAKYETCKVVNGKKECMDTAAKNAVLNAKDEVVDKANDVKKKVD